MNTTTSHFIPRPFGRASFHQPSGHQPSGQQRPVAAPQGADEGGYFEGASMGPHASAYHVQRSMPSTPLRSMHPQQRMAELRRMPPPANQAELEEDTGGSVASDVLADFYDDTLERVGGASLTRRSSAASAPPLQGDDASEGAPVSTSATALATDADAAAPAEDVQAPQDLGQTGAEAPPAAALEGDGYDDVDANAAAGLQDDLSPAASPAPVATPTVTPLTSPPPSSRAPSSVRAASPSVASVAPFVAAAPSLAALTPPAALASPTATAPQATASTLAPAPMPHDLEIEIRGVGASRVVTIRMGGLQL